MYSKIKKYTALFTAFIMCAGIYGCSEEKNIQDAESEAVSETSAVTERRELTDEEKERAEKTGISEERYCLETKEIEDISLELLRKYYDGMMEKSHDKCFSAFPDFYKKAIEDENKEYNETNEEYMKSIYQNFVSEYGADFEAVPSVNSLLQFSDESLKYCEEDVNKTFGVQIELNDAYEIYFSENVSGSLNQKENPLQFFLLKYDDNYYLYDDYFENRQ